MEEEQDYFNCCKQPHCQKCNHSLISEPAQSSLWHQGWPAACTEGEGGTNASLKNLQKFLSNQGKSPQNAATALMH